MMNLNFFKNSPGDSDLAWSVGSTREDDTISEFSSRGSNGYGTIKPEVSAPGEKVVSAYYKSTNSYAIFSGTSMACPHVAGAMALMLSANKTFTFDQIKQKLEETAVHPTLDNGYDVCGSYLTTTSSPYPTYPNNAYGNGRISVANALGL
jgi:subtilisin family serine protease